MTCKHDEGLYQSALYLFVTFDPKFLKVANDMAKDMELRTSFVIERLALAHLAELAANEELAGRTIPKIMNEFAPGMDAETFYQSWKDNKVKQANADRDLADRMVELNKYLLPSEQAVNIEELRDRKALADLLADNPPEKHDMLKRAWAHDKEMKHNH
jgi:hypothetical protein